MFHIVIAISVCNHAPHHDHHQCLQSCFISSSPSVSANMLHIIITISVCKHASHHHQCLQTGSTSSSSSVSTNMLHIITTILISFCNNASHHYHHQSTNMHQQCLASISTSILLQALQCDGKRTVA
ncbi:hypothetical protein CEXT_712211 [Caerostris extrusa]|uniref:Uncharacterized protein n=1 Tax=Caerostris extrusa TaxID=172846 RepID=A0AAV4WQN7_CAEEX|nr:hypothetical protein CEXT_712211 [Caerostris extrusa]